MSSSFSKNILLTIEYDGSSLSGWQDNQSAPTVEEKLKRALTKILEKPPTLQAASRTDAGVHAVDQKVNFILTKDIPVKKLPRAINTHLPKTIRVVDADEVPATFHPTLDCKSKTYDYYLCLNPHQLPFFRNTSWHIHSELNLKLMRQASNVLIGKHDFSSFCTLLKFRGYKNHLCEVKDISINKLEGNRYKISITADRFLYRMARTLVGNLVAIGKEEISVEELKAALEAKDRKKAMVTAPAHGLFLAKVSYH